MFLPNDLTQRENLYLEKMHDSIHTWAELLKSAELIEHIETNGLFVMLSKGMLCHRFYFH